MAFLRVVEVFPPVFPSDRGARGPIPLEERMEMFVEEVRGIRQYADLVMVANIKDPGLVKLSTLEAALLLQDRLRVEAVPVVVVRDVNRLQFLSTVLTAMASGLSSIMLAWGDRYPRSARATNVHDFGSLAEAIRESSKLRARLRSPARFLAPVDLTRLRGSAGVALAQGRVRAGADLLLAQPPTTAVQALEAHASLLRSAGLADSTLLSVFPFRDSADVRTCEKKFGWRLPRSLHEAAQGGESSLLEVEREVIRGLRAGGYPGVYVSTRGTPAVAARLLS